MAQSRLGEILLETGKVSAEVLNGALEQAKLQGKYLGSVLIERGDIDEETLATTLAQQLDVPVVDVSREMPDQEILDLFPKNFAKKNKVLPFRIIDGKLYAAMADPLDLIAIEDLEFSSGMAVERCVAPESMILKAIERVYPQEDILLNGNSLTVADIDDLVGENQKTITYGIISNKGGVGKTHIAVNLAYWLAKCNKKVLLIDADLGNADVSIKTGFVPEFTLLDFFNQEKKINQIVAQSPYGYDFIGGVSGDFKLANLSYSQKMRFVRNFANISQNYDIVLYDLGAGISRNNLDFALGCDEVIIITTPQAVVSGYACIKAAFFRFKQLENKLASKNYKYKKSMLFSPKLIANQVFDIEGGEKMYQKIRQTLAIYCQRNADDFTLNLEYLGPVLFDKKYFMIAEAKRSPFSVEFPNRKVSECFSHIARMVLRPPTQKITKINFKNRFKRFMQIFTSKD